MTTRKNDPSEVSTVKGLVGGYIFVAPCGTKLPTDYTTALDEAFVNIGYVNKDGLTESVDFDTSDAVQDMNGQTVIDEQRSSASEAIKFTPLSINKVAAAFQYGSGNVTDASGLVTIKHNWLNADEDLSAVCELVLKGRRRWRKVIPKGHVNGLDDLALNKDNAAGREVTLAYSQDSDGTGCIDYIQSTETKASQGGAAHEGA